MQSGETYIVRVPLIQPTTTFVPLSLDNGSFG